MIGYAQRTRMPVTIIVSGICASTGRNDAQFSGILSQRTRIQNKGMSCEQAVCRGR